MFSPQISIDTCSSPSFDFQQALGDVTNSRNEQVRAWVGKCRKSSHWSLWRILWRNELEKVFREGIPGNPASYKSLGTMELTQQVTPCVVVMEIRLTVAMHPNVLQNASKPREELVKPVYADTTLQHPKFNWSLTEYYCRKLIWFIIQDHHTFVFQR